MQDIQREFDTENKHPNIMGYYKGSPYNLSKEAIMLRQFVCFNLNEKLDHIP